MGLPLKVSFSGEAGLDCGGLARDLICELFNDVHAPTTGLFVALQSNWIVPIPARGLSDPGKYYSVVGGLMAMGIRAGFEQPWAFAPLLWVYLAGGRIESRHVIEADPRYAEFARRLSRGDPARMPPWSGEEWVSVGQASRVSNVESFLALCAEARIAEVEHGLAAIRDGFWANLGFARPEYATSALLSLVVCGDGDMGADVVTRRLLFAPAVNEQWREWLKQMIASWSIEQRKLFLKFATGASFLGARGEGVAINVVPACGRDRAPVAHTCFHKIELAVYSSYDKMRRIVTFAIENCANFTMT
jgi:hypothetical protein